MTNNFYINPNSTGADAQNALIRVNAILSDNSGNEISSSNPLAVTEDDSDTDYRFDANDAAPIYIGINKTNYNADTAATTWIVFKFTYSGSDVTRIQKRENISWDNRASSF